MRIEHAFMIKHPHVPSKLYKYRTFCPRHLEALERNILWMSSPSNFNDVHEVALKFYPERFLVDDVTAEEYAATVDERQKAMARGEVWQPIKIKTPIRSDEWWAKIIKELHPDLEYSQRLELITVIEKFFKQQAKDNIQQMAEGFRRNFSVLALSAEPASHLMWAHYSASHSGFAIEYDFGSLEYGDPRRRLCFPVFYTKKIRDATRYLARTDMSDFNNRFEEFMCLVKKDDWAYERQWRIVHAIGEPEANSEIAMPKPSAILLGSRVAPENENEMRELCRARSIPLKRMVQSVDSYDLSIIDIH
jgi:hypothetical protein